MIRCGSSTGRPAFLAAVLLASALLAPDAQGRQAAPAPPPATPEEAARALPPPLRSSAMAILAEPDEDRRQDLAEALIEADPLATVDFFVALLEKEPSADVREEIVDEWEGVSDPRVTVALERRVVEDPSPGVMLAALDLLRARALAGPFAALGRRLEGARSRGDEAELVRLLDEHERWVVTLKGGMLPGFLRTPPPVFSVRPAGERVRVLAFGDYGDGSAEQRQVSRAMLRFHRGRPFDFAITLGDNFYSKGMESPGDPRWKSWWDDLYDPLGIEFYATLGNHDWGLPDSPAAEIAYTRLSPSWRMPAAYYTFMAGEAQFFALDTDTLSRKQLAWLAGALDASAARWKVVYGHHPIYSEGQHRDNPLKIERLLPVLRDRADVYLAGHDHDMQHLRPEGRLHFFVAGTGGKLRPVTAGPRSLFARSAHGFAVLDVSAEELRVTFVTTDLRELYSYALRQPGPATE